MSHVNVGHLCAASLETIGMAPGERLVTKTAFEMVRRQIELLWFSCRDFKVSVSLKILSLIRYDLFLAYFLV